MSKERINEIKTEAIRTSKYSLPNIYDGRYKADEIELFLKIRAGENVKYTNR